MPRKNKEETVFHFETALAELESLVEQMEKGELRIEPNPRLVPY